jgi:ribose transport system substrate-binding protein
MIATMRTVPQLGLIFLLLGALQGDQVLASSQGKSVALLTTPNQNPFIGVWNAAFKAAAEEAGMKVTNLTTPYDAALQAQQVDDAMARRFDLIVLLPTNHQAIIPSLMRTRNTGLPVVLIVSPIQDYEDLYVSFIGPDHYELGRLAGESLARALHSGGRKGGRVAAITGSSEQLSTQLRVAGFRDAIGAHSDIEIVAVEDGKWNTALSERIAAQLLVRFAVRGGLDGIYGMADNQAAGIIQAIEAAGMKPGLSTEEIVVVGSNCMEEGIRNIRAGKQYSTNTQLPTENGKAAAEHIARYFNGEKLEKHEILKADVITQSNVNRYAESCTY